MKNSYERKKFNDLVAIVSNPNCISKYDLSCAYYTELALSAVKQKPKIISKIIKECPDYFEICKTAILEDPYQIKNVDVSYDKYDMLAKLAVSKCGGAIIFVNVNAQSYFDLCKLSLLENPEYINLINKKSKDYYNIWEYALKICYSLLRYIGKEDITLFPLIIDSIKTEPNSIYFVNRDIEIYPKLANIAYKLNPESTIYMDINRVEKTIVFEILKRNPEKIKVLSDKNDKEFYKESCKISLRADGSLIRYISSDVFESNLDDYFELTSIAQQTFFEIDKYSTVLDAMIKQNRLFEKRLTENPNILGNNIYSLLDEVDREYSELKKDYVTAISLEFDEIKRNSYKHEYDNDFCPVKKKI